MPSIILEASLPNSEHVFDDDICYTGARRVRVPHPALRAGQTCPDCRKGKVRPRKEPAVAIQVKAQPPIGAVIHEMEQLRCDTCGKVFTAPPPPEAGEEKYDASVGVMVGLMRYGSGMPFYRLERLQKSLGVPQGCNCNVHARRNFVEIQSAFPEECRKVVESFSEIYRVEAQAKADGLAPKERLEVHQAGSQPVMEELKAWLADQMDGRKAEPNSGLGQAIA